MSGLRLTPGDFAVLRFVGRHRFATVAQVARVTGRTEKKIYPRLLGLRSHGLVTFERPVVDRGVYLASRAGLRAAELALPVATVELGRFFHDRAVTELAAALEANGAEVVSGREMRAHDDRTDTAVTARYAVPLPSGGWHYPDLLVAVASGRYHAVEVALVVSDPARRERILTGYADAAHVDHVIYHVAAPSVAAVIRRSAAALTVTDRIEIRSLTEETAA
ncbi:MAG TPA: hypothetical protein VKY26_00995 [Actinomycetota bacterium]|nr:hypothetical protein [Actinomycetota bacterium]